MPIHKVIKDGKVGYRWGQHGKIYFGAQGKAKAAQQAAAAYASGYKKKSNGKK